MAQMNPQIDLYFADGCGRCPLYRTPECKVHNWQDEMKHLRAILLDCGLTEELKWKVPCYTIDGSNVVVLSAFKEYCALSFFKGVLLNDPQGILARPGENSQAARLIRFTDLPTIIAMEPTLRAYIQGAIAIEQAGLKVEFKKATEFDYPEEFIDALEEVPAFKKHLMR